MAGKQRKPDLPKGTESNGQLAETAHLQVIEGNPLSADELAMFEMFEREQWASEDRRAYIGQRTGGRVRPLDILRARDADRR